MGKDISIQGIILRINESGYQDKVINIITSSGERVAFLAKNIKQHTSKRAQMIDLGNHIRAKCISGYSIHILTDVSSINTFPKWKTDLEKISYLQLLCEVISNFIFEDNPEPKVFTLLLEVLNEDSLNAMYLVSIFLLKLLDISGNLPELDRDISTYEKIDSSNALLAINELGYIKNLDSVIHDLDRSIYKIQMYILRSSIKDCLKLKITNNQSEKLLNLVLDWTEIILDKPIKSRDILRSMNL